ncbi:hypothetical protein DPMN_102337 [Dreissena polymorpha]|uniref:Uncharacterized protein n=1 Tax=Dreissena polymorpha TaxID=45954 RepID=A0A9D4LIW5_DREPO|nr:hypothetical protein DPMN_102337 [Dreissena polymorpha]
MPSQKLSDKKQWHKVWVFQDRDKGYLDLTNPSKARAACVWNRCYREKVAAELLSAMNFSQPKHGKVPKRKPRPAPDTDQRYR